MEKQNSYLAVGVELGDKLDDGRRRYCILRYIKSGGFGNTYEAEDRKFLGRRVAIKELFVSEWCSRSKDSMSVSVSVESNRISFTKQKEKFIKEAIKLNGFVKDGIVRVIDVFEANGTAYYAMDYIDGGSLAMRLKSKGGKPMTESEVRGYLDRIMDALEYVHSEGLLHLDLKPGNIMVDNKGKVTLIDFGASKQVEAVDGKSLSSSSGISYTRGFAPTEQIDGSLDKMGTHTDMYALGATLYNLLTGKVPPSPSDIDADGLPMISDISQEMWLAIKNCLIPNRNKRIKTVSELRELLAGGKKEPKKPSGTGLKDESDSGDGETIPRDKKEKAIKPSGNGETESDVGNGETIPRDKKKKAIKQNLKGRKFRRFLEYILGIDNEYTYDYNYIESQDVSTSLEVDLGLSVCWAGWNVGATSPEEDGYYFAWGETYSKAEHTSGTYSYYNDGEYENIGEEISGTQYDAARAKWGSGWRMPTEAECQELVDKCKWKWIKYKNEIYGMKVTGPNGNSIFMPASGYRSDVFNNRGSFGYYWSGSLLVDEEAWILNFFRGHSEVCSDGCCRENGLSVRPVKAR